MGAGGSTMDFDPEKERIAEQLREEAWRVYDLAQAEKKRKLTKLDLRH